MNMLYRLIYSFNMTVQICFYPYQISKGYHSFSAAHFATQSELLIIHILSNKIKQIHNQHMSSSLAELMQKLSGNMTSTHKIGSTTSINEQVEEFEANLTDMKRNLDRQQKQQSELQFQLKKFEQSTKTNFKDMNKQFSDRIEYLTNLFKATNDQQNANFEHMEHQNQILHDEHDKMNEIGALSDARTSTLENNIGMQ